MREPLAFGMSTKRTLPYSEHASFTCKDVGVCDQEKGGWERERVSASEFEAAVVVMCVRALTVGAWDVRAK